MVTLQPIFMLLLFGYKLIKQTKMITLEEMTFDQVRTPKYVPEAEPQGWLKRLLAWLMLI